MQIKSDEHVFIAGRTGSGKTTVSKFLLRNVKRLIVCDSKGTLTGWNAEDWTKDNRRKFENGEAMRLRVVAPLADEAEFWGDVFEWAYWSGNCRIYIDELYAVVPQASRPQEFLRAIYTRGREFNVSMCAVTQRPSWVPLFCLSESSHYFCFRLNLKEDRQRMAAFMGEEVLEAIKDKHGFWYFGGDADTPNYFKQYQSAKKEVPNNGT